MTYEEKLDTLLQDMALKRKLTPAGRVTRMSFDRDDYWVEFDDMCKLLLQLQDDFKILTIIDTVQSIEDADPTQPIDLLNDYRAVVYITIELKDEFDSFYPTYLLKKKTRPSSLSYLNLLSVLDVMLSIDEKLQMAGKVEVQVPVFPNRIKFEELFPANTVGTKIEYATRSWDSLNYLKDKGLIEIVKTDKSFDAWKAQITLKVVDVEAFDSFRQEVADEYDKRNEVDSAKASEERTQVVKGSALPTPVAPADPSEVVYAVTYGADQRIMVNGIEIGHPNFDTENANVFELLFDAPNEKRSLAYVEEKLDTSLTKKLYKIVENLGFTKELKNAFFNVSETSVIFHNPVTRERLDSLGLKSIKF